jgi:plasmid stabilization system protein ParE
MKLVWSESALADLERFAAFLQERHPALARRIVPEIARRARMIADYPEIGRSVSRDGGFRELSMPVLNAAYVFRYSIRTDHVRMLRVFHSRERRDP